MEFSYGELLSIYHALEHLKGNKKDITFNNKNGLVNFEPVSVVKLMEKVKDYGESLEK